jgi:hypothetical protein
VWLGDDVVTDLVMNSNFNSQNVAVVGMVPIGHGPSSPPDASQSPDPAG